MAPTDLRVSRSRLRGRGPKTLSRARTSALEPRSAPRGPTGRALLADARLNRDLAFTLEERATYGLEGLLPPAVQTLPQQVELARAQVLGHPRPLDRFVALAELEARNQVLFHRLLRDHLEELLPLVYTPTVGEACQRWSEIYRRPRGVTITTRDRGRVAEVLASAIEGRDVRLIVLTDGERILGLGDLGAGGMGVPVGKLALYTAAAGLHPESVLPMTLDVGTDDPRLRADPRYIGLAQPRLRGPAYYALVEELVDAVRACCPRALLQWEDFKKGHALRLLEQHRERLLSFNDDIQGTAAVALSGVLAASRRTGVPLAEQRVVILGAGGAGAGIAKLLRRALSQEGLRGEALTRAVAVLDSRGLLVAGRTFDEAYKEELAWPRELAAASGLDPDVEHDLFAVVTALGPTALIGASAQPGAFDERSVRAMAREVREPAIFPLSNPTSSSEATPDDLLEWTAGRALVATGSPFGEVAYEDRRLRIAQANNVWIFPGVGLGALASGASQVTDGMFLAAAIALADAVTDEALARGELMPSIAALRDVTVEVAVAVGLEAARDGVAEVMHERALRSRIARLRWEPEYPARVE